MSEKSSFFNAELVGETWDRTYTAEDYANYFGSFIGNGVFPNPSTNLQIVANGDMTITVKEGKAWINGYMYHNDSDLILSVDPADGVLKRIDRIVVKLDFTNRVISCKVKKGTFASSPVAPTLQRDMDIYELGIADILIDNGVISIIQSKITDTRLNTNLCGIVTQTVNEIDTNELYNKLQAYIDERGQDVALWVDTATTQWGIEFNTWFDTIKGILSGDIAGNLANRITTLENTVNNLELTATNVTIADTGNKFTATNVEGALLEAINKADSAFQSANNGKSTIATAIGSPVLSADTFSAMGTKIDTLKNTLATNNTSKGVTSSGVESLESLINKVANINLGKKWASGTATKYTSGIDGNSYISFSNLGFVPTIAIGYNQAITSSSLVVTIALAKSLLSSGSYSIAMPISYTSSTYDFLKILSLKDNASYAGYLTQEKVEIPVTSNNITAYKWIAFE